VWLGFFIPEKDGLITEFQALHQTFGARAEEEHHHPPRPPPKRNESLLKQITATLYCEAVEPFGRGGASKQRTLCCNEVAI
jgi:hypothetical protein